MDIGLYHEKQYRIGKFTHVSLHLLSHNKDEGFTEFINSKGVLVENKYIIDIPIDNLEDAYALKYEIVYKGIRFKAFQPEDLYNDGKMEIWTDYDDIAEKYDFERMDMFFYYKLIEEKDIEELVEIREPIFQFKDTKKVTKQVIAKDKIMQYAEYIASFA